MMRSQSEPLRTGLTWEQEWEGLDMGLIRCWERGREKQREVPELATAARNGQLVILPWKGGVRRRVQGKLYGTPYYLAMWQGLRGDDLDVDLGREMTVTCSATAITVTFTSDKSKYATDELRSD